jgi:rhodanese-related sulfurtransferase
VVKLFESSVAGTGLSLGAAKAAGFDAMSVLLIQLDRAHFYPTKELMTLEMVVDKSNRRVLGVQGFGSSGDAMVGRINAVAAILKSAPTVDDISNMELAYSPPFAAAMDILNSLANLADNALAGINRGVGPDGFKELWENRDQQTCFFLDCRENADAVPYMERNPETWHNVPQGEIYDRLDEIPADRPIVLICNTGARSYEAQIMLDAKGYKDVTNIQGGMAAIKKYGVDI